MAENQELSKQERVRPSISLLRSLFDYNKHFWNRLPVYLVFYGLVGAIILELSKLMPDYVAVLLLFLLGSVGWAFLLGLPVGEKKGMLKDWLKLWSVFATAWGAVLCALRGLDLRQHNDAGWLIWGIPCWLLAISFYVIVLVFFRSPGSPGKSSNSSGPRSE